MAIACAPFLRAITMLSAPQLS